MNQLRDGHAQGYQGGFPFGDTMQRILPQLNARAPRFQALAQVLQGTDGFRQRGVVIGLTRTADGHFGLDQFGGLAGDDRG